MIDQESLVASPPTPPPTPVADAVHWLQAIESDADRVIAALPEYPDESLLDVRAAGVALGKASWRIVCAVDAQILSRAQRRQGKADTEGTGLWALAVQQAKATGLHPDTVRQNAEIHSNFFSAEGTFRHVAKSCERLQEKGYYEAALRTDDPAATLEEFAHLHAETDGRFTVREAWRMVKQASAPDIDKVLSAIDANPDFLEAYKAFEAAGRHLVDVSGLRLASIINSCLEEVRFEAELPPQSYRQRIESLMVRDGFDEIDEIVRALGDVKRDWVIAWFHRMRAEGWMEVEDKERVEGARGATRKRWSFTPEYWEAHKHEQRVQL